MAADGGGGDDRGMKDSGIGRERGLAGIRNYLQIKNVAIRL
jgi:acyl-CoA reductase-like NAD-dependent aldehyde dehydrogenase